MTDERRPARDAAANNSADQPTGSRGQKPAGLLERLELPDAVLTRGDLGRLGYGRRAVDHIFAALPVVVIPGSRRPFVKVCDYLALVEANTYDGTRVR